MQSATDDVFSRWIRPLIWASAGITAYAGLFALGLDPASRSPDATGVQLEHSVGVVLLALGATLAMLCDLAPSCRPKRLALSLAGIHLALAVLPAWHALTSGAWPFGSFRGRTWIIVQAALAAGFFLSSRKVSETEEPEVEEALAQNGIARSWLQAPSAAAREERRRLARDLHDSIKQQLFSVKMSAAAAEARWDGDPAGARTALADIRRSAQAAMVEMQALLKQLRPETVVTEGLVEALREQAEALGYRTGAAVHFELGELPGEERLPPRVREQLFRIAQEALSNIARHARPQHVHVWLGTTEVPEGSFLVLRIRDDGQGFDPAAETSGMGLHNIRERVESLLGRLVLESSPGNGTELRIYVALQEADACGDRELRRRSEPFIVPVLSVLYIALSVFIPELAALALWIVVIHLSFGRYRRLRLADARGIALSIHLTIISWWTLLYGFSNEPDRNLTHTYTGGLIALPLVLTLWIAWSFLLYLRKASTLSRSAWAGAAALALLLLGSLAGILWGFQGDPDLGTRIAVIGSVAFYGGWWFWNWKQRTAKP